MLEFVNLEQFIRKTVNETRVFDIHTHLYSEDFKELLSWGIDEVLTYHYLIAELFRYKKDLKYDNFNKLSKSQKAELVWDTLFVKNTPITEACRGVVTILKNLNIDPSEKNLNSIRKCYSGFSVNEFIDKVFTLSKVENVVMTNEPFDENEKQIWKTTGVTDSRFLPALRLDELVCNYEKNHDLFKSNGLNLDREPTKKSLMEIKDYLKKWIEIINPLYMAISLPPDFGIDENRNNWTIFKESVLPLSREYKIPIALMLGVKRGVNPSLGGAGDGIGKFNINILEKIVYNNQDINFLVTMLSRENQHELCVVSRKLKNMTIFGCWWFLNTPSIIKEITAERIELLGLTMIPQHSDARVIDQLIYKWENSRNIIAEVLIEKYSDLLKSNWTITEDDIIRDIKQILNGKHLFKNTS